ncbi:DEAH-box helicase 36 [Phyllostomus discolor]|uniref:DEAH-box helicase 36 n=1 Tax=Phyllostomus discolor TaxID=89673 RepID=A0A834APJ3_9CHIR|nr:DEAH-box helicase 36 [Phyllostomus discolor]
MRTSSIYLYDCTEVSPYCLLFFGGDISIQKDNDQETIAVDEWIVFQSPARIAHLVKVIDFSDCLWFCYRYHMFCKCCLTFFSKANSVEKFIHGFSKFFFEVVTDQPL